MLPETARFASLDLCQDIPPLVGGHGLAVIANTSYSRPRRRFPLLVGQSWLANECPLCMIRLIKGSMDSSIED